ncbi:hypothetical protein Pst134EA_017476 [Puccinia striiformis f. sp. tritici]|uniref:hypothetical protein n=1 Tax=Puccinia striiformis f. sp. tritici TaxID=168172 RepID=UPI002008DDA3|nr:hypothetical protein Pst134EA_017476 [Puccinia striiformis f. sp. tritici]KAH9461166.1 hypothetical protein Pst134EA_017476 [Puccinia striiformis f. sp. tritici]
MNAATHDGLSASHDGRRANPRTNRHVGIESSGRIAPGSVYKTLSNNAQSAMGVRQRVMIFGQDAVRRVMDRTDAENNPPLFITD